jgi:hypothetical protein
MLRNWVFASKREKFVAMHIHRIRLTKHAQASVPDILLQAFQGLARRKKSCPEGGDIVTLLVVPFVVTVPE